MKYLLKNGKVWFEDGFKKTDLLIDGSRIGSIEDDLQVKRTRKIDCSGCFIIPGIIDMHVHTGEPINDLLLAENESMTASSCLQGGVTTIGVFITETDKENLNALFPYRSKKFNGLPVTVRWHLTPKSSRLNDLKSLFDEGCNIKLYTTYREPGLYSSYKSIDEILECLSEKCKRLAKLRVLPLIHCEDDETVLAHSLQNPFRKAIDHTLRRPEIAEIRAVERVLELAVKHNYPVHIVHVSTPEAALLIKEAKKTIDVTCETAPHYLLLNEDILKRHDGHRWLCTPPLRSEDSRQKLLELACDGLFDAFATDHCPFSMYDKDRYVKEPGRVPMGLPGTGALLPLLYEGLYRGEKMPLHLLIKHLTLNPAKILGLYPRKGIIKEGADADLLVLKETGDIMYPIKPSVAMLHNPWKDWKTSLRMEHIFVGGKDLQISNL